MDIVVDGEKPAPWLRCAGLADEPFLFELFVTSRERELSPLPTEVRALVARQQYDVYRRGLVSTYPKAEHLVVELSSQRDGNGPTMPTGMILVMEDGDSLLIIDLAIHPSHRNRGLGQAVLEAMMNRCRQSGKVLRGSVTPYNPARRLYARLGIAERQADHAYIALEWRSE